MEKEHKLLPQAIKIIVENYGKDVVNDVRMVNIMGDVVSLEDPDAVKTVLREVLKLGYGRQINSLDSSKEDYYLKINSYSKTISDSLGFKDTIVKYVLFSIAYGIGICPSIPRLTITTRPQTSSPKRTPLKEEPIAQAVKNKTLSKIVLFFIILLTIGGGLFYLYRVSENDKEQFNKIVGTGDSFLSNGDYSKAVDYYKEAYNSEYTLNDRSLKSKAVEKINHLIHHLYMNGQEDNYTLLQALRITQSALQLNLENNDKDRLNSRLYEIETRIAEKTDNGLNTLISNLSANHGALDENGIKLLSELLTLSPDEYWLNFIKNKKQ